MPSTQSSPLPSAEHCRRCWPQVRPGYPLPQCLSSTSPCPTSCALSSFLHCMHCQMHLLFTLQSVICENVGWRCRTEVGRGRGVVRCRGLPKWPTPDLVSSLTCALWRCQGGSSRLRGLRNDLHTQGSPQPLPAGAQAHLIPALHPLLKGLCPRPVFPALTPGTPQSRGLCAYHYPAGSIHPSAPSACQQGFRKEGREKIEERRW